MAVYPSGLPTIPDDGTWNHSQVGDEIEAIAAELGTDPSGASFTTVGARIVAAENRITAVEGATTTAGVEVASGQLTTDYDIKNQSSNVTWTDIGLSIAVPAQTRAYNLTLSCTFVASTSGTFAPTKTVYPAVRIVDSAVTTVVDVSQFPIVMVAISTTYLTKGWLSARIAAGQAATTWKVQARNGVGAPDAQVTALAVYAGTEAPAGGVTRRPAQLQAITV